MQNSNFKVVNAFMLMHVVENGSDFHVVRKGIFILTPACSIIPTISKYCMTGHHMNLTGVMNVKFV